MSARVAASVALAGVALVGVSAPAFASKPTTKPDTTHRFVCHPTGKGWVLINPAQASSHIDELTGAPKHEHDGRHDQYAVNGACPVVPSTPTPTTTGGTPSSPMTVPTSSPSTTQPAPSVSTGPSPSPTSSTPSVTRTTTTTAPVSTSTFVRPPTTPPISRTTGSSEPSTDTTPSPRRSVPSSTVAPPELAHTGAGLVTGFLVGLGILLVGALFHGARILGARKGTHR